jgi:hypothetical protein
MSAGDVVTQVLREGTSGNQQAPEELTPLVRAELPQLPAAYLRNERHDHTCNPQGWYTNPTCGWLTAATERHRDTEKTKFEGR